MNPGLTAAFVSIAFLLLPAVAPAQFVALNANFNQSTPGEQVPTDLPGEPDGDFVDLRTTAGTITVETDFGVMTDQPLVYKRSTLGSLSFEANLAPVFQQCDSYVITWTSMIDRETGFFGVGIKSEFSQMGQLQYDDEFVLNMNGFQNPLSVGYQAGVPQDFQVTIDMLGKSTSLSIDGVAVPEAQSLPFIFANTNNTFFAIQWTGGGVEDPAFVIDDILVLASDCASVPTEETSWGGIKSRFR